MATDQRHAAHVITSIFLVVFDLVKQSVALRLDRAGAAVELVDNHAVIFVKA